MVTGTMEVERERLGQQATGRRQRNGEQGETRTQPREVPGHADSYPDQPSRMTHALNKKTDQFSRALAH